ncbi:PREDICTED: uncharacterized protein LOC105364893 [Ceratosolen solmsi marchali]|uniref:Uncharacterized protein LOC105364893 n=1 Tax=Ceratosolen solmsi marchali TaxID=326594 RepID=A0AAJ6YNG6_9HYME|nr:PREDICTED: uncharacterized protein LOC105364893 [Ceratosolen solmsi marchali]
MLNVKNTVCDTRCQQFQKEAVSKEERLKSKWFIKNRQLLYDNLEKDKFFKKHKNLLQKKTDIKTSIQDAEEPVEIVKKSILSWRPSEKDVNFALMKPIKSTVKDILYAPKDASFISKKKYFQERLKEKPEDKFYYPYCSSWVCGWRLKDYPSTVTSKYGVRSVIQSSFYRRNASSIQRDPDWYRMCQIGDPKNFNDLLTY